MKKRNVLDIIKKVVDVVVEFGCMEICSRGIDKLTDKYTNNASKLAMRAGGISLGGYLGTKASEYINDTIDRGVKLASKYVKIPEEKKSDEEETDSPA